MSRARNCFRRRGLAFASPLALATALSQGVVAQTVLPSGGKLAAGGASISQSGPALTVTQTTPRAVVNWDSFSVGSGGSVTFAQPGSTAAILNRVTGATTSTIAGALDANGQVYLVNPNGVAITSRGTVQVGGGFVASTLGIADSDFMNGKLAFTGSGASASVNVAGAINTAPGGFVGLLGGSASVSGEVSAPLGKVGIGSGEAATLNLTGDNFLQVALPTGAKTADGKALVDVSGKVSAAGGSVVLKAATVADAVRNAINIPGELSATSVHASGGSIIFSGGPGGDVAVSGRVTASGKTRGGSIYAFGHNVTLKGAKLAADSPAGKGGAVTVTAQGAVSLASASISADGATGGGAIRVGGDFHGAGAIPAAQQTTVDSTSTLSANSTGAGDGGTIALWSQDLTTFAGTITALGGPKSGDGGYVEVSASPAMHGVLAFSGFVDLRAANGKTGSLLLDPYDITISTDATTNGSFSGGVFTPTGTSTLNNKALDTELEAANVTVSTGGATSAGTDAGNITVAAPVTWRAATTLTLLANGYIDLEAPITATTGNVSMTAGNYILQAVGAPISATNITLSANGYIDLASPITATTGNVSMTAGNYILVEDTASISATNISLTTTAANPTAGSLSGVINIEGEVSGVSVKVNSTGTVWVDDFLSGSNSVTINASVSNNGGLPIVIAGTISCGDCSLHASGAIVELDDGAVEGASLSAISDKSFVELTGDNIITGDVTGSGQSFSFLNEVPISVGANGISVPTNGAQGSSVGSVYLVTASNPGFTYTSEGLDIIQKGTITATELYAFADGNVVLTNPGNSVSLLGGGTAAQYNSSPGTYGGFSYSGANASLQIGAVSYNSGATVSSNENIAPIATPTLTSNAPAISAGNITIVNQGNIVLNGTIEANVNPENFLGPTLPNNVALAATGSFINNAGAGAVTASPATTFAAAGVWQIFSAAPSEDTFGGLDSNQTAVWATTYAGNLLSPNVDRYVFAFQPTITVTSGNLSKTYGTDNTSVVTGDYTISGLQPADPTGAYLGDTAAAVYSGTPFVSSAGSAANASATSPPVMQDPPPPYTITVANGTFTVGDGYALTLASTGKLTVNPATSLTITANDQSVTYGGALPMLTVTYSGFVAGDTAASLTTAPTVTSATPSTANVGIYANTITASGAVDPNYTITYLPGALTITPRAVTYTVANANSNFGSTPVVGAATLSGVLPGQVVTPTVGVFSAATPVALSPTTPTGAYTEEVTALNNANYVIAPVGNSPGELTIYGPVVDPGQLPGLTMISAPAGSGGSLLNSDDIEAQLLAGSSACSNGSGLADPTRFSDPKTALLALATGMEKLFQSCQNVTPSTIATALDAYAARLEILAPQLPPQLRSLPAIIERAAQRIRAAKTPQEAVGAVISAIAEVHKAIALLRAGNPDMATIAATARQSVDATLQSARVSLLRAASL